MARVKSATRQNDQLKGRIAAAVMAKGPSDIEGWAELSGLSDRTEFLECDVPTDFITLEGDRFSGLVDVYVMLRSDSDVPAKEGYALSEGFGGTFTGRIEDGDRIVIDRIEIIEPSL